MDPLHGNHAQNRRRGDRLIAVCCAGVVVGMVGAAYAAVPFYNWFCRATGFNGTPQIAISKTSTPLARQMLVRFDANVGPGLPLTVEPVQTEIDIPVGEVTTASYRVTNRSAAEIVAQAAYNVTPLTVGAHFQKINCFCFTDQKLAAGETRELLVVFYIDPALNKDSEFDGLNTITLSYTFYRAREAANGALAASKDAGGGGRL
jgi:cytochrome c oxidase assembly protein subunit 11